MKVFFFARRSEELLFDFAVVALVKSNLGFGHIAGCDDAGEFSVGPKVEEDMSVLHGSSQTVVANQAVCAFGVREEANSKGVF